MVYVATQQFHRASFDRILSRIHDDLKLASYGISAGTRMVPMHGRLWCRPGHGKFGNAVSVRCEVGRVPSPNADRTDALSVRGVAASHVPACTRDARVPRQLQFLGVRVPRICYRVKVVCTVYLKIPYDVIKSSSARSWKCYC